jgi:lipid-binding SYLF domain-containing protein
MSSMTSYRLTRRGFTLAALAACGAAAGCNNGIGSSGAATIDARVAATLEQMFREYPNTRQLADMSAGMLVMPLLTEAGLWVGGGYGRGALVIDNITVDYYSKTKASAGFQFGAKQFAHVLFFMTDDALASFRRSAGWVAGADIGYVVSDRAASAAANTNIVNQPILAAVFGEAGLYAGASLEGAKYTRIIP